MLNMFKKAMPHDLRHRSGLYFNGITDQDMALEAIGHCCGHIDLARPHPIGVHGTLDRDAEVLR